MSEHASEDEYLRAEADEIEASPWADEPNFVGFPQELREEADELEWRRVCEVDDFDSSLPFFGGGTIQWPI